MLHFYYIAMEAKLCKHSKLSLIMWPCRRAFELAFATSYMFAGSRPTFIRVGEITFKKPVEVGDLLRLHSTVLFTHEDASTGQVSCCFTTGSHKGGALMGSATHCSSV